MLQIPQQEDLECQHGRGLLLYLHWQLRHLLALLLLHFLSYTIILSQTLLTISMNLKLMQKFPFLDMMSSDLIELEDPMEVL